ncbi:hypothetical protein [Desulfosarcina widdelii]|nr:hypothetical protein [Desulfosarcina widdelii]
MESKKAFIKFNNEGIIIGRLLVAYADIELSLFHCVNVTRDDFDTVYKAMFKERGESRRIGMADTFGRQNYHKLGLGTQFEMAISSVRYCLKIRNQYAHCVWYDDSSGFLAYANLEEGTESNKAVHNFKELTIRHIDIATLNLQEQYFEYTDSLLAWVNFEGRRIAGKPSKPPKPAPKQIKQPKLYLEI